MERGLEAPDCPLSLAQHVLGGLVKVVLNEQKKSLSGRAGARSMSMHCISPHRPPTSSCLTPIPISGADERVASRRPESSPHIPTLPGREIHDRADGQGRAQFALHIGFALGPFSEPSLFWSLSALGTSARCTSGALFEEIAQALGQGQDPTSSRSAERTGRRDGAQAKKQQRVPSRRHVRICTGEETERRVSMSNIYDIVINMPADPPAGLSR
jgi:hypothetical protein